MINYNSKKEKSIRGVTIIELLVVIFIIGVFVAFFVPNTLKRTSDNARVTATRQKLNQLKQAIVGNPELVSGGEFSDLGFKGDVGRLPRNLMELAVKPSDVDSWNPFTKHGWNGPYIRDDGKQSFIFDAWGDSIKFLVNLNGDTIGLTSRGIDGEFYGTNPLLKDDDIKILF